MQTPRVSAVITLTLLSTLTASGLGGASARADDRECDGMLARLMGLVSDTRSGDDRSPSRGDQDPYAGMTKRERKRAMQAARKQKRQAGAVAKKEEPTRSGVAQYAWVNNQLVKVSEAEPSRGPLSGRVADGGNRPSSGGSGRSGFRPDAGRRQALLDQMKKLLREDPAAAVHLRDQIADEWLKGLRGKVATLAIGNPTSHYRSSELGDIALMARRLVEDGYYVIYDADSAAAPAIRAAGLAYTIGISAHPSPAAPSIDAGVAQAIVLSIQNPYLRMKALGRPLKVVISADSVTGLGIQLDGNATQVYDPNGTWSNGLREWMDMAAKFGLGLSGSGRPAERFAKPEKVVTGSSSARPPMKPLQPDFSDAGIDAIYGENSAMTIERAIDHARAMVDAETALRTDPSMGGEVPGGTVIFGSGSTNPRYTGLVYDSSRAFAQFGVPVTTGGSGGYMEVANQAAFDAGGVSVGIPLGGSFRLSTERRVAKDSHTQTVNANGYEQRIPLLMYRRGIITLAPGGRGTMTELATTYVAMGASAEPGTSALYLSTEYYGPLTRWIADSSLPEYFKQRTGIADDADGVRTWVRTTGIETMSAPSPRNGRTAYVPPTPPPSSYGGGFGGGRGGWFSRDRDTWGD